MALTVSIPALRKVREERGTQILGDASDIKARATRRGQRRNESLPTDE